MKFLAYILLSTFVLLAQNVQAQQFYDNELKSQTVITIQKDLQVIGQDEELSFFNVLYVSPDQNCRIESQSQQLKAGENYSVGYIAHSYSKPKVTIELISLDGGKKAIIECLSMPDEAGLKQYNKILEEALLMVNP